MHYFFRYFPISCAFLLGFLPQPVAQEKELPYVVMISLDGFRWDYSNLYPTPYLYQIAQEGVKADFLKPSFPTKTFPNHYTIVTGLNPDHHGIIANKFHDPSLGRLFSLATPEKLNPAYYGGEPIWNIAEKAGIKTASYFWAGSDVAIDGLQPSIWKPYRANTSMNQRIDSVVQWLQLPPSIRPHLITIYMEEPDKSGHDHGPVSAQTRAAVEQVDSLVGKLWQKIRQLPIGAEVNLIILSDHGLSAVNPQKSVRLSDYMPAHWLSLPTMGSPIVHLKAANGYFDSIYAAIKKIPHIRAYPSGKVPRRLHFGNNIRTLDFTLIADAGWSIITHPPEPIKAGNHGFDINEKDMQAIFYAVGPAFKKNYRQKSFNNVDVYPLLAHIFKLDIPKNDGRLNKVKKMLLR